MRMDILGFYIAAARQCSELWLSRSVRSYVDVGKADDADGAV